jgi:catechol 2,3-dioxygenase-like lactoylglutathione lyase family enzyme
MPRLPTPSEGILLTHFIVSDDVERSRRFYTEVLGGETVFHGDSSKEEPSIIALANGWVTINLGGGPTADKPTVTLEAPRDLDRVCAFLNIRVADLEAATREQSAFDDELQLPPGPKPASLPRAISVRPLSPGSGRRD